MRIIACVLVAILLIGAVASAVAADAKKDAPALPPFLVGCCFGLRVGLEYNDGAQLHWREWCRLIPVVSFVIAIWDGVECQQGMTKKQWAEQNGANWY
ncbi:MAG: hypothetical protein JXR37_25255 [Kiritimatiellae bacterium]|nr:hypothetical protein [Kiritimatiellia bacterium]